jgi:tetratricopeptide (TPR) repeat protein
MVDEVWAWLSNSQNQTTLTFMGSGVAVVAAAVWALYTHFKKSADAPAQKLKTGAGGHNVIAGDSATVIIQRDPEVGRLLNLMERQQRDREASDRFHRQLLQTTQQKTEELERELRDQRARAIEYIVQQAAEFNASSTASAAKRGLEIGNTQLSEEFLHEDERRAVAQGQDRLRHAAELARQQGALALLHGSTRAALGAYQRATEYEPENVGSWSVLGDLYVQAGNLTEAMHAYSHMLTLSTIQVASDPSRHVWQRNLSVSYNKVGDVLMKSGELINALVAYRKGLAIAEILVAQNAANAQWQRDLSVSYERIGDVLVTNGRLDEALMAYQETLAIAETLAAKDPANTDWQRDLSVSYDRIGDVLATNSKPDEALVIYRKGLVIAETLAAKDATNKDWQQDLSISYDRIGDVLVKNSKLDDALAMYCKGLAIRETLAAKDIDNTDRQRDLSVSHNRVGDVLVKIGNHDEALAAYRRALAIREALTKKDSTNTEWQIDVAVSCSKLGTHVRLSPGERQDFLQSSLDILKKQKALGKLVPNQDSIAWLERQLQDIKLTGEE